jgi:hypothetical protein
LNFRRIVTASAIGLIQISVCDPQIGEEASVMAAHHLRRDIAIVLTVKLCIVVLAAMFVFNPGRRPAIDGDAVHDRLLNDLNTTTLPAGGLTR